MSKPRIFNGICEFCGTPAANCKHYKTNPIAPPQDIDYKSDLYKKIEIRNKKADIVIPHHNRHDHLKNCLDQLPNEFFNIIVVSGGSFAQNCNKGARLAETDKIFFVNDDTIPDPEVIAEICHTMKEDIVGVPQTIPSEGNRTFYGVDIWEDINKKSGWSAKLTDDKDKVKFPGGFFFMVKRSVWEALGGFDEQFINGGEDSDFFFRALDQGYTIGNLDAPILHYHSQSEGRLTFSVENQALLNKRWTKDKIFKLFDIAMEHAAPAHSQKDKLDILVANNHLDKYAGSETWTYTMVKELERLGHNVDVYTKHPGRMAEKLNNIIGVDRVQREKYDLLLINHNTCLEDLKDVEGFKIMTCHGIYPQLEQPVEGADAYVAITAEVKRHLKDLGFDSSVIYNGIDLERFTNNTIPNSELKNVLCMSKGVEAIELVKEACERMELNFSFMKDVFNVEDEINKNDLVVSLGRGSLEAMACGRETVILDSREYMKQGIIGEGIFRRNEAHEIIDHNYSGRAFKRRFDVDMLCHEFSQYDLRHAVENFEYVRLLHNVKDKVQEYLNIYDKQIPKNN